jgi:hypothetical protein
MGALTLKREYKMKRTMEKVLWGKLKTSNWTCHIIEGGTYISPIDQKESVLITHLVCKHDKKPTF